MPGAAYRFLRFGLGFRLSFVSWLGAFLNADYRVVFGTGEVEDDEKWYGPSSTGGLNFGLGATARFKGFFVTAEYGYTRYFYAFQDPAARQQAGRPRIAGGALDILHTLMATAGYAF
jgi:hypothetical protein